LKAFSTLCSGEYFAAMLKSLLMPGSPLIGFPAIAVVGPIWKAEHIGDRYFGDNSAESVGFCIIVAQCQQSAVRAALNGEALV